MKYIILILLLGGINTTVYAQGQPKSIVIGDTVPDIKFAQVANFDAVPKGTRDFRGKLLILDFWATWCSPCVSQIPNIEKLQKQFKGQVEFVPVTNEKLKTVEPFLKRLYASKLIKMRTVIADTALNKEFPHTSIPFYVWIDPSGKLIATTDASQINSTVISASLKGDISTKNKVMRNYRPVDVKQPLFLTAIPYLDLAANKQGNLEVLKSDNILFQSTLTKFNPDLRSKTHYDSTHFVAINTPVINFYRIYYGSAYYKKDPFIYWSNSRCKIEIKDTMLFNKVTTSKTGDDYLKWSVLNAFTYELVWKNCKDWTDRFKLLGDDIDKYFGKPLGIEAVIEKRMVPSDVLVRIGSINSLKTNSGPAKEAHDAYLYNQENLPISTFINRLEGYFWQKSERPIFDETGLLGTYDMNLNCDMNDIGEVNKALSKYGLKFITGDRMAEVLIIRERQK